MVVRKQRATIEQTKNEIRSLRRSSADRGILAALFTGAVIAATVGEIGASSQFDQSGPGQVLQVVDASLALPAVYLGISSINKFTRANALEGAVRTVELLRAEPSAFNPAQIPFPPTAENPHV